MDAAAWWAVALAYFLLPPLVPLALTRWFAGARPAVPWPALAALEVPAVLLTGFGWADLVGIGAWVLPFGLALAGVLAGLPGGPRVLAPAAGVLGLALLGLAAGLRGVPQLSALDTLFWAAFVAACLALLAAARASGPLRGRVTGVAALAGWALVVAVHTERVFVVGPVPILASLAWLGPRLPARSARRGAPQAGTRAAP